MSNRFEFFCSVKAQTDMALLVNDGDRDIWVPKSLIDPDQRAELMEMDAGDSFELSVPEWWADQKELT